MFEAVAVDEVRGSSSSWLKRVAGTLAVAGAFSLLTGCNTGGKDVHVDLKGCHNVYTVRPNDTISGIAGRAEPGSEYNNGDVVDAILAAMKKELEEQGASTKGDLTALYPGQIIPLPANKHIGQKVNCPQ